MTTSPQFEQLNDLCGKLDSFCERLERRQLQQAATPTDGYLTDRMVGVILPVRDAVAAYRDFHARHTGESGRVDPAQRESFFDLLAQADDAMRNLSTLTESTLGRSGSAPGSQQRLSVFFRKVVADERMELRQIHADMLAVIERDLTALKRMPRHLRLMSRDMG